MRHEAEVLARTLVGLPSLGNNRGAAGGRYGEQGDIGPVAADPLEAQRIPNLVYFLQHPTTR